jgi:hypothetical protein
MKLCPSPTVETPNHAKNSAHLATCERPLNLHAISAGQQEGAWRRFCEMGGNYYGLDFWHLVKTWHTSLILIQQGITFQSRVRGGRGGGGRGRKRDID